LSPAAGEQFINAQTARRSQARTAWRLIVVTVPKTGSTFSYRLDRNKLRKARRRAAAEAAASDETGAGGNGLARRSQPLPRARNELMAAGRRANLLEGLSSSPLVL
jgi:hypothetical protein